MTRATDKASSVQTWIDTDAGIDDALALLLAAASPEIEIVGVTSVHGNVDASSAAANAKRVLRLAGVDVPVWEGARLSLLGRAFPDQEGHGRDGLGDTGTLSDTDTPVAPGFGPLALLEALATERLTVVALGPLTNIALALAIDPASASRIERLIVMGGAMRVEGNVSAAAEFNVWCDPEAAHRVLESGINQSWIGLDVTLRAILPRTFAEEATRVSDARAQFVGAIALRYGQLYRRLFGFDGIALHDPVTIAYLVDPSLITMRQAHLEVELAPTASRGRTLATIWPYSVSQPRPNVDIAVDIDVERVIDLFAQRVVPGVRSKHTRGREQG